MIAKTWQVISALLGSFAGGSASGKKVDQAKRFKSLTANANLDDIHNSLRQQAVDDAERAVAKRARRRKAEARRWSQ